MWRQLDRLYTVLRVSVDHDYLQPRAFHDHQSVLEELASAGRWSKHSPYLHGFVYLVPQFLEMYGTIYQMNCQLVKLKNHHHNAIFHRGSQKGGRQSSYCRQVVQRENRSLFARVYKTTVGQSGKRREYRSKAETKERRL